MKRQFISLLAACFLLMALACPALAEVPQYVIGICQLEQHAALENAARGFQDAVHEQLGDQVVIREKTASGDLGICSSIINAFLAEDVDLILANSTQVLQVAYAATLDTPILGVSVTDYPAALGLDEWNGVTGTNVSGTSDLAPLDAQAELLHQLFPDAKRVGLLYCSAEVNSEYQVRIISGYLTAMGYTCKEYAFTDTIDMYAVTQSACQGSDVIYVPTDNTIAACTELIRNVIELERVPIIGGDEAICASCGVATLCIDYYELGRMTGQMACDILTGKADVSTTPIGLSDACATVYNAEMCELLGVTIPEGAQLIGE